MFNVPAAALVQIEWWNNDVQGHKYLDKAEYMRQLSRPDSPWTGDGGAEAWFDERFWEVRQQMLACDEITSEGAVKFWFKYQTGIEDAKYFVSCVLESNAVFAEKLEVWEEEKDYWVTAWIDTCACPVCGCQTVTDGEYWGQSPCDKCNK